MGIFDWKSWIVILIVVVLIFGTKKLKNLGSDLGSALKSFKKALNDEEQPDQKVQGKQNLPDNSITKIDKE